MTRLTEDDVTTLTRDLEAFEARLLEATGLDLRELALRTVTDGDRLRASCAAPASPPCPCRPAKASSRGSRDCVVATCCTWAATPG